MSSSRRRGPGGRRRPAGQGRRQHPARQGGPDPTGPAAPPDDGLGTPVEGEPDLLGDVREMLAESSPWQLLGLTSSLLAALDPRQAGPVADEEPAGGLSIAELVTTFLEVDRPETTALLTALHELMPDDGDDLLLRRMRRELARRDHDLPGWLRDLGPIEVPRAVVMSHVLGDGDNILLDLRTGAGDALTAVVYIDHNLGTLVKDAFVVDGSLDEVVASFREAADDDPDTSFDDLDRAEARARVEEAIELAAITFPPFETETWPACRPLVERALRALPEGGVGHPRPEWSEEERDALIERFLASPQGRAHADDDGRDLTRSLLWFACDYGPGDPLRWSPVAVEMLLADWLPRKVLAPPDFLARAPELLRALIRFSHAEQGLREELTRETLAAVDRWEPEFLTAIEDPGRAQGIDALLEAMGAHGEGWVDDLGLDDGHLSWLRERLLERVGGEDALQALDDAPLPDEPFAWEQVPEDVRDRVGQVLELLDARCDERLDVEHRTACRRLLADIAAGDPDIFRRRGRAETAAAAIAWSVARANDTLQPYSGGLTAKELLGWFGVSGSVSQRAETLLRAVGVDLRQQYGDVRLGTTRYLVSARRRALLDDRARLEELADDG